MTVAHFEVLNLKGYLELTKFEQIEINSEKDLIGIIHDPQNYDYEHLLKNGIYMPTYTKFLINIHTDNIEQKMNRYRPYDIRIIQQSYSVHNMDKKRNIS
jgi:hypothetical protein